MLKEIGKTIRWFRNENLGMSQEKFAKKINYDRTYLSRIESGKQNITIETLKIICNGLNISLKEFFDKIKDI